jgi:type IV pilus assembly protein PilA
MKRSVHGFTLVEVMIVTGVIGILSAVALPAYQNYSIRAKISEAILALGACRTTISEVYSSGGDAPPAGNWGCETTTGTRYVASIDTDNNGVATATVANIGSGINGRRITLRPLIDGTPANAASDMGKSVTAWRCGGPGTNLKADYLPASCRGA